MRNGALAGGVSDEMRNVADVSRRAPAAALLGITKILD
jgi:hypothetical protein